MIERVPPTIVTPAVMVDGDLLTLAVRQDNGWHIDLHVEGGNASDRQTTAGTEHITDTVESCASDMHPLAIGTRMLTLWLMAQRAYRNLPYRNDDDSAGDPVPAL